MSSAIAAVHPLLGGVEPYEPISDGSKKISRRWVEVRNVLAGSAADWLPTIIASLKEIRNQCRSENWDGEGAHATGDEAFVLAEQVLERLFALLPKGTPAPDIVAEHDGELSISWSGAPELVFALSIGAHDKVNYAGQLGKWGAVHAWQTIDTSNARALDDSLQDVVRHVGRLYQATAQHGSTRRTIK